MMNMIILLLLSTQWSSASSISSTYNQEVKKKECVMTEKDPLDVFKQYNVEVTGFNQIERRQIAGILDAFSRPDSDQSPRLIRASMTSTQQDKNTPSSTKKLFDGLKLKQVDTVSSCVGGGRYKGNGLVLMAQKKPSSCGGKAIPFSVTRVAHEICHHIGHSRGDGHDHSEGSASPIKKRKVSAKKKHYDGYPGMSCAPKGSSYSKKLRNENFAEICAAYWVHPEAIAHCPEHVKYFKKAFGKESPCKDSSQEDNFDSYKRKSRSIGI